MPKGVNRFNFSEERSRHEKKCAVFVIFNSKSGEFYFLRFPAGILFSSSKMTGEPPESSTSKSLHSDKNPYENILKDWTLEECYNESKINYWDFHIPNHADLKNLENVDDFHFFSSRKFIWRI